MKRAVGAMGILGLVCAVALPRASAQTTLLKDDFSTDALLKSPATYIQGSNPQVLADPANPLVPFFVMDGVLDTVSGDGTAANADPDNPTVRTLLLTGDKSWADVSIQAKIRVPDQGTGVVTLVLRAAKKTKPSDPDTWYELRYTTGNSIVTTDEEASGITPPETNPNLRIMKVVNGKWTQLVESTSAQEASIPGVMNGGDYQESGAIFRFTAKGDLLQGFYSLDGVTFTKVFEAHDSELKAGLVGFDTYDYHPVFDDLLVTTAP